MCAAKRFAQRTTCTQQCDYYHNLHYSALGAAFSSAITFNVITKLHQDFLGHKQLYHNTLNADHILLINQITTKVDVKALTAFSQAFLPVFEVKMTDHLQSTDQYILVDVKITKIKTT